MNREEAKELFRNDKNSYGGVKSPMSKIDLIYDSFDKQIESLKNCCNCNRSYLGACDDSDIESDCDNNNYKHWQPIK